MLNHIQQFTAETFTDNHKWAEGVLKRYENEKAQAIENGIAIINDAFYKQFAAKYGNNMFVISMLRQYETYLAQQKTTTA